jgi:diadenosine tetraphosphate (Ap4A) HIT family hydrolase
MFPASPPSFALDPQLARDTLWVGDLALTRVLLVEDSNYRWLILVPRREGAVELIDLADADRALLMDEIAVVSRVLKAITHCDKLNVAALGNAVAQLHVHVIARKRGDAAWPKPVWGVVPPQAFEPQTRDALIAALRGSLQIGPPQR